MSFKSKIRGGATAVVALTVMGVYYLTQQDLVSTRFSPHERSRAGLVAPKNASALGPAPADQDSHRAPAATANQTKDDAAPVANGSLPGDESIASKQEFEQRVQNVLKTLPEFQQMQDLSEEEIHHTPEMLLAAGENIGDLLQVAQAQKSLQPLALQFLVECAQAKHVAVAVRAVCLSRSLQMGRLWQLPVNVEPSRLNAEVSRLAGRLSP
jgi:hypothetical protein